MKVITMFATANLVFAPIASGVHAQSYPSTQGDTVQEFIATGQCVPETFNVPAAGLQVSYRLAGPAHVLLSGSCRRLQQAGMPKEKLPTDNCADPRYNFSERDAAAFVKQDEIIRNTDPVKGEPLVLTPQLTGCYVSAKAGIHTIYLPRGGMAGFALSIRYKEATPDGRIVGHTINRLFHQSEKDLKADPMQKVPICALVPGQPNLCGQ
jgi:hypothetical protein